MEFQAKTRRDKTISVEVEPHWSTDTVTVKVSDRKRNLSEQQEKSNFSVLVPPGKTMKMVVNEAAALGKFEVNVAEKEEVGVAVDVCQTSRFHLVLGEPEKFVFFVSGPNDKKPRENYVKKDDNQKEFTMEMVKDKILARMPRVYPEDVRLFCKSANTREVLEESRTLASYGILPKALFEMRIVEPERYIKVFYFLRTVRFLMDVRETVGSLKEKLKRKFGVPKEEQFLRLYYGGNCYMNDDARTLASYGISNKDTIRMRRHENEKLTISVRCIFKKAFKIEVGSVETISNVKAKIQEKMKRYAVDEQILKFGEKVLDNEKKVAEYGIKNENAIFLSFRRK